MHTEQYIEVNQLTLHNKNQLIKIQVSKYGNSAR
jgi:hypothetical protein